jgi:epoxyqueuosine reductase
VTEEKDFFARQHMHNRSLLDLFKWTEDEFLEHTEGSAIRRIGYRKWKRNIAVGLGNQIVQSIEEAENIKSVLQNALDFPDDMVREHIQWALAEIQQCEIQLGQKSVNRKTLSLARSVEKGMPKHG